MKQWNYKNQPLKSVDYLRVNVGLPGVNDAAVVNNSKFRNEYLSEIEANQAILKFIIS